MTKGKITTGWWCQLLSTEGHKHCDWRTCDCTCHLHGAYGAAAEKAARRPHSFSREDWARGKRPPGWKRAEAERRRLARLAQNDPLLDDLELGADH